ncbi:MAG: ABC transporter permease [Thermomicrobiales bacterium]|nr:ABC transporter permease [Thermomicrobiales bacterium]
MGRFVAVRLFHGVVVVFLAVTAVFFMLRLSGDPALLYVPIDTSPEEIEAVRERMGLNDPLVVQYAQFITDAAKGDFGDSTRQQRPATEVVLERLPATLELGVAALLIAMVVGIPLGVFASLHHGSFWDRIASLIAVLGQALPNFWLGLLLILAFSVSLNWLPTGGRGSLQQLIMPAIALSAASMARYARLSRSIMLDVLHQDYIRTAHAKGLNPTRIITIHAFKNASISIVTITGLEVGRLLGGAVVVENVFAWPGLGRVTVQALENRDFAIVTFAVVLFAVLFTMANLLADLAYGWFNPQVRYR